MRLLNKLVVGMLLLLTGSISAMAQDTAKEKDAEVMSGGLQIKYTSVVVDDQDKALEFYTKKLGFVKKQDIPLGEFKWLTVVSSLDLDGTELILEPNAKEEAATFYKSIYDQGMPATMFAVDDIKSEYDRLVDVGVKFRSEPKDIGSAWTVIFDDTCGNLIMILQEKSN